MRVPLDTGGVERRPVCAAVPATYRNKWNDDDPAHGEQLDKTRRSQTVVSDCAVAQSQRVRYHCRTLRLDRVSPAKVPEKPLAVSVQRAPQRRRPKDTLSSRA